MPLKVILAGHNVDQEALQKRVRGENEGEAGVLSPETLSAAYARISRDSRPIPELRADARLEVERARKSNRAIIFDMGHASVAEHAVFNLDILGLSRLCAEELEHHRLASYTEKSQRYIRLEGEFVLPEEISAAGLAEPFRELVGSLGVAYQELAARLTEQARAEAGTPQRQRDLESRANEDARYLLPLCAEAQLGMTANARTLELCIAHLASHPLAEVRALGAAIHDAVSPVAPSVIRYTRPTPYLTETTPALGRAAQALLGREPREPQPPPAVRLVLHFPIPTSWSRRVCSSGPARDRSRRIRHRVAALSPADLRALFNEVFRRMELWDSLPRAFEQVEFGFEIVASAAAFGQLKRHRIASLLTQPYDPALGVMVPESIRRLGAEREYLAQTERSSALYQRLLEKAAPAAPYALTNAHRRRVLFTLNGRALGHFSRLRCDPEAQWDIREIGDQMVKEAQRVMPLAGAFYGGKDCVERLKRELLG